MEASNHKSWAEKQGGFVARQSRSYFSVVERTFYLLGAISAIVILVLIIVGENSFCR